MATKFTVSSSGLLKKIQLLSSVVGTNNTMPILNNILFELGGNQLKMHATDLETTITTTLEIELDSEDEEVLIAVPAKMILDILKLLAEQPLTFEIKGNNVLEMISSQGSYSLSFVDGDEFPKTIQIPDPRNTSIDSFIFSRAINNTLFAVGNDDIRPIMNGVFMSFSEKGFTFVATDAHKLSVYDRSDIKTEHKGEFVIPKKSVGLLRNVFTGEEDVKVEYNDSNVKFTMEDSELICRLIDGKFPNYEAVIPRENPNVLIVDREVLLNSIRRVSLFSNKVTHQVRLKITGSELSIYAEDVDFSNQAEEHIACQYTGDDMEIGFNSRFFSEMLSVLGSENIQMEMSAPNKAGILSPLDGTEEGENIRMLVMPVVVTGSLSAKDVLK